MAAPAWHLTGCVLADAAEAAGAAGAAGGRGEVQELPEAWVHQGRLTFTDPGVEAARLTGYVLPGLVDVHCHIGLGSEGAVDRETSLAQARADLEAGTLLVRDAGSPAETRWLYGRNDMHWVPWDGYPLTQF